MNRLIFKIDTPFRKINVLFGGVTAPCVWANASHGGANAPLTIPFFLLVFIVRLPWEKRRILWLLLAWLVFVFSTW
ncbi:MAG: hypothetical protein LBU34_11370, partial [Planctomycetaceae bacterium]|nr:hypothetical protein [Planctomycetaceae bacterium]